MSQRFTLNASRVECLSEQAWEWGKDEMNVFGFAIGRKPQPIDQWRPIATGYRSLGSYGDGEVRTDGILPLQLVDTQLPDDGLDVLFYAWLVEEDGGGVRAAAAQLQQEFNDHFIEQAQLLVSVGFPRECVSFTAFYKAALLFQPRLEEASTAGRNDELYAPYEIVLQRPTTGPDFSVGTGQFVLQRSKRLGHYRVTFDYRYESTLVVHP